MFSNQDNIIIVDNNEGHIKTLNKVFIDNYIKCRTFVYDTFQKNDSPLTDVRIAFFDINLRDLPTANESEIFNELANALNDYISPTNGPFALVFWTQNKSLIPAFIDYINTRRPLTPKPYNLASIDKDDFLELAREDLKTTLELIFEQPSINLFLEYERNVKKAASETINQLYSIIPNAKWGDNTQFDENLDAIFSKIAIQQLGLSFAKKEPDKAIYESLNPILNNQISLLTTNKWKARLNKLRTAEKYGDVKYPNDFKQSELNTLFHIDFNFSKYSNDARGLVFNLERCNSNFDYFFKMDFDSWFFLLTKIKSDKYSEIKDCVELIAIEISSACDFSQDKQRLNKYILALKTPPLTKKDKKEDLVESTFNFDYTLFGSKDDPFNVWVNFNYVFSALPNDPILGTPIFLFKKEIMDLIGNRYANYVSRIGITSF